MPEFWLGFIVGAMVAGNLLFVWFGRQLTTHRKHGEQLERRGVELQKRIEVNGAQLERLQAQLTATDKSLQELLN